MTVIRARDFAIATAIGILPNAYLLVALGGSFTHPTSAKFIVIAAVILALALLAPIIDRAVRNRAGLSYAKPDTQRDLSDSASYS
jgi:uncharacterized membrane protein YdjX (TVP38/TMEM64 family)